MSNVEREGKKYVTTVARARAYAVHLYTASGLLLGLLAAAAISEGDFRDAFFWMTLAVMVDATDGFFAQRFRVRDCLPQVDGRKIDDIVDYLNYTFLPMVLVWRAGWLPDPAWLWASVPLVTSVLAFAHTGAKEEEHGFFRGFPSYWNIFALYTAVWLRHGGPYVVLTLALLLSLLNVLPVRFIYPNRSPRWRKLLLGGGLLWLACILVMLNQYPEVSPWLVALSLVYPLVYILLSVYLDFAQRTGRVRVP